MRWNMLCLAIGLVLASCANAHHAQLEIDPMVQTNAPVQIVSIQPIGDNMLATVTVKNATDRSIQGFMIAWAAFRPANCAVSGPSPRLAQMGSGGLSAYAEMRFPGVTLGPGEAWGARPLKPHEETDITSVFLSRASLLQRANDFNARKVRVQVGITYADYQPEAQVTTYHIGPDWRDVAWERDGNIFDLEDAANQACN
jgi:hypothetical protein